jgi:hypothetical protein
MHIPNQNHRRKNTARKGILHREGDNVGDKAGKVSQNVMPAGKMK